MTELHISRQSAETAVRQRDWRTAFEYYAQLAEAGEPTREWLDLMEASALLDAVAGDLDAQHVLGSIGTLHYMDGSQAAVEPLRRGLKWIVSALRQNLSPSGLQMLVVWYGTLRSHGTHDDDVDAFLAEPEPRAVWRRIYGVELP